ncbi:MAG TPA: YggS family pyridoxal phosphate-dependent enzyme [Chitinophagaceae bacterium]|nr:YggS family pyridoxal phosphate-dependent enzyme [Chitinophagaceae bacterium]
MAVQKETYLEIKEQLDASGVRLIAVSKTKPVADILELYELGQRDFGENYVQELVEKQPLLPKDINWHFIGHLQRNKVKYIAPFVHLIHGVDSYELLQEIARQGAKNNRTIPVLLQVHIAEEETKFGLDETGVRQLIADLADKPLTHIVVNGFMGMASYTGDAEKIKTEFQALHELFKKYQPLKTSTISIAELSMGMSGDYKLAVKMGSTMVRIGSLFFGARTAANG